jgi:hypothetical protein
MNLEMRITRKVKHGLKMNRAQSRSKNLNQKELKLKKKSQMSLK